MANLLQIASVVGARPQFVKLAPIARALFANGAIKHTIVHTGQHYDDNMSSVFFDELEIPRPDVNLDIGSVSHAVQTGRMMEQLERWFESRRPNVVLVYGDTNSTLAACLAATKMHIPVAHIEAGLRSFNRKMPEELNRVATDHCSDRLYSPTPMGMRNLELENLASRAVFSGDVMRDAVQHSIGLAEARDNKRLPFTDDGDYAVLTLHRPSNTEPDVLSRLLESLDSLAQKTQALVFPAHPRTRAIIAKANIQLSGAIRLVEPLSYLDMLLMVKHARMVLTDSGGLQKEAAFLGTPCITLREETEWTETLDIGVNQLVGTNADKIFAAVRSVRNADGVATHAAFNQQTVAAMDQIFGRGDAANRIAEDILVSFR